MNEIKAITRYELLDYDIKFSKESLKRREVHYYVRAFN